MGSHRLKVVIKSGDIVFLLEGNFRTTEHHLPYGTSKLCNAAVLPPVKKGRGKNSHSTDKKITWSSARTAAAAIIAAVWDTSAENSFANSVDNFLLTCSLPVGWSASPQVRTLPQPIVQSVLICMV